MADAKTKSRMRQRPQLRGVERRREGDRDRLVVTAPLYAMEPVQHDGIMYTIGEQLPEMDARAAADLINRQSATFFEEQLPFNWETGELLEGTPVNITAAGPLTPNGVRQFNVRE